MIIFLTGSAGLLGGAIAQELADSGHGVIALVHRETEITGNSGQLVEASSFGGELPRAGEVKVLQGNVADPGLALSPAVITQLSKRVDCVIHCAALVKFEADFEVLREVNVEGTRNVAQSFPDSRLVHVSTAYTCGVQDGPVLEELHSGDGPFANGYEQSKALAEIELRKLRPDAIIARPSIVVGEFATGQIRSFDTIYRAFKFIAEGRIEQVPTAEDATLNFVPIDYVVAGVCALATQPVLQPVIAHLCARESVSTDEFLQMIGMVPGLRSPKVTRPHPVEAKFEGLAARVARPYLSYFVRSPQFKTDTIERIMGSPSPQMDEDALLRQIRFCIEAGFIRPRAVPHAE